MPRWRQKLMHRGVRTSPARQRRRAVSALPKSHHQMVVKGQIRTAIISSWTRPQIEANSRESAPPMPSITTPKPAKTSKQSKTRVVRIANSTTLRSCRAITSKKSTVNSFKRLLRSSKSVDRLRTRNLRKCSMIWTMIPTSRSWCVFERSEATNRNLSWLKSHRRWSLWPRVIRMTQWNSFSQTPARIDRVHRRPNFWLSKISCPPNRSIQTRWRQNTSSARLATRSRARTSTLSSRCNKEMIPTRCEIQRSRVSLRFRLIKLAGKRTSNRSYMALRALHQTRPGSRILQRALAITHVKSTVPSNNKQLI